MEAGKVWTPTAMHLAILANRQTANRLTPKPRLKVLRPGSGCLRIDGLKSGMVSTKTQSFDCILLFMDTLIAGGFWEQHCEKMLGEVSFQLVFPAAWPSVFFHPTLKLLLAVYVDDFKMLGRTGAMKKGWELMSSEIDMDSPTPLGRYLGCEQKSQSSPLGRAGQPLLMSSARCFLILLPSQPASNALRTALNTSQKKTSWFTITSNLESLCSSPQSMKPKPIRWDNIG